MSKLDYLTIAVVVVGIIALSVLGYKIYQNNTAANDEYVSISTPTDEGNSESDYTYEDDEYTPESTTENDGYYIGEDEKSEESFPQEGESTYTPTTEENKFNNENSFNNDSGYTSDTEGPYMVIAGSFSLRHNAENHAKKIRNLGYSNTKIENFWGNNGMQAAVMVDRFSNLQDAKNLRDELQNQHQLDSFVKKKQATKR